MNRCKKCGTTLPEGAKFCNVCGTPFEVETVDTAQAAETETVDNTANATTAEEVATVAGAATIDNSQQFNGNPQFSNNGQQFNGNAQFNNNGQQFNGNPQFGNNGQQFQQAAPKETASAYYGKQPYTSIPADNVANKGVAICAYFGLLWLIPLLTAKHSPFAKFHANQGILVFITTICVDIVIGIIRGLLTTLSWRIWRMYTFFTILSGVFGFIAVAFTLVLSILGIVYAAQGKMKEIPVLGQFHIIK